MSQADVNLRLRITILGDTNENEWLKTSQPSLPNLLSNSWLNRPYSTPSSSRRFCLNPCPISSLYSHWSCMTPSPSRSEQTPSPCRYALPDETVHWVQDSRQQRQRCC